MRNSRLALVEPLLDESAACKLVFGRDAVRLLCLLCCVALAILLNPIPCGYTWEAQQHPARNMVQQLEPVIKMATRMISATWPHWGHLRAAPCRVGVHFHHDNWGTRLMASSPPCEPDGHLAATSAARRFLDFASETGSPYHSVTAATKLLQKHGFRELKDDKAWALKPGGKYYVTKDGSDIMAFAVGNKFSPDKSGLSIIGAHTDSPCLRLRPISKLSNSGMMQVGVQTYGGGLWHTWFDRPLGCAGKVIIKDPRSGHLVEKLARIARPMMVIPNLAIHLTNAEERKAFAPNTESHLQPVLCSKLHNNAANPDHDVLQGSIFSRHHAVLLKEIANEIGYKPEDIVDIDICLMDAAPGCLVGVHNEFVSSPRIDNLLSTWAATEGVAEWATPSALEEAEDVGIMVSFDHEEVGSISSTGADGATLRVWLKRILDALDVPEKVAPEVLARSFLISADCAHGLHPNYAAKHQAEHRPEFGKGIVIKTNANQRYATTALTAALLREVCARGNVSVQEFVVRNDSPCGSTIGPIISAQLGIRTIDIGASQWAMHSCRETCAAADCDHLLNMAKSFYANFRTIDASTKTVS